MRILLTIHHELDPNAGASGATLKLGRAYEKLGHQVQYYSIDNLPKTITGKAQGLLFPWFLAAHLLHLSQNKAVDVVDASTGDAWVWAKYFHNATDNNLLLVTRAHGLEHTADQHLKEEALRGNVSLSWRYHLYGGGFRLWEVSNSLRQSDLVFQLNQYDLDYAVQKLGVRSERSHLVSNGIPEEFLNLSFEPTPLSPDSEIGIALVASYNLRKGIGYSVPALNTILTRYPQVKVSFLGTEVSEETVYADFELSLRDRIQVIPHFQHKQLPMLLKGHQIKLFPSLSEGFSLALPEAMACGLAPVASKIPGSVEILKGEQDSIVIAPRNNRAIEQALERLITDRQLLDQLRRNAYTKSQQYGWIWIAQHQLTIYEKALEKRSNLQIVDTKAHEANKHNFH
jgi:glycosyltransferase involved in cell wall biosynthesis